MTRYPDTPATVTALGHLWLSVPEAARRLGVTTGRIYHLTSANRLRLHPESPHGLTYIRSDSVEAYRTYQQQLAQLQKTGRALAPAGR